MIFVMISLDPDPLETGNNFAEIKQCIQNYICVVIGPEDLEYTFQHKSFCNCLLNYL